jgi:hypothetical protein
VLASRNIRLLTRYSAWANSLLYLAIGELPEAELDLPVFLRDTALQTERRPPGPR